MASRGSSKFNVKAVEALIKSAQPGRYSDGAGLFLSIGPKGNASWVFIYRSPVHRINRPGKLVGETRESQPVGKTREMGLGPVTVDAVRKSGALAAARELADVARKHIAQGVDPLDIVAVAPVKVPTFAELTTDLIASFEPSWRNDKTKARWERAITVHAAAIADKPVDQISNDDVLSILKPLWASTPETASKLRGIIERVFDGAKVRGFRTGDNPAAWRGHLKALLPPRRTLTRGHHKMMPWADVPAFIKSLRQQQGLGAMALEFTVLTCVRTSETLQAEWAEFDLKAKTWTIPGGFDGRMKEELEHVVPLSLRAIEILETVAPMRTGDLVFPGVKKGKPLSDMTMTAVRKRMELKGTVDVHGFRSSFRTWAGDTGTCPREVAEGCLAHAIGDAVEAAYNRSTMLERRRLAMNAWANFCAGQLADNVVPIRQVG
jgi:integrase